jgi:Apea-like HEPN
MPPQQPLTFPVLKQKQRAIRQGFPEQLGLRTHRALSWLQRAELETEDADVRFILLWISFNAAFAADLKDDGFSTRDEFRAFFEGLIERDQDKRIYNAVWTRFSQEIRLLLDNQYVFAPFWYHHNGMPGYADWEAKLAASKKITADALIRTNTFRILITLFDRLYVLRNQLVHGGATWNGTVNRSQVTDGAAVLANLVPVFIDIMMDNPDHDWGKPFYPVIAD